MNKEKLKDYLNRVTYAYPELEPESDERPAAEYKRGFNEALELAISKIDQLDEPEKVVVPQWFADWYESRGYDMSLYGALNELYITHKKKVEKWAEQYGMKHAELQRDIALIFKMGKDGYTVGEKKYYVKEPTTGQFLIKDNQQFNGVKWVDGFSSNPESYTEKEIKDYDERYWPFAEEVSK